MSTSNFINLDAPAPATVARGLFAATVAANESICTDHFRLTLRLKNFPASKPGQFVQLACLQIPAENTAAGYAVHEWNCHAPPPPIFDAYTRGPLPWLRRPFSIAARRDFPDNFTDIDIIHRVVGKGTKQLAAARPGEQLSLIGPLGNSFWAPDDMGVALLVGGGVGVPPMLYLAQDLANKKCPGVAFIGAQRRALVPLRWADGLPEPSPTGAPILNAPEFAQCGIPTVICTDDGSWGLHGLVTHGLSLFIDNMTAEQRTACIIFCCGPTPMMRAVALVAEKFTVRCQLSLEQPMACGMGTCQSCVVKVRPPDAEAWQYKLTCTDGPVFDARRLVW